MSTKYFVLFAGCVLVLSSCSPNLTPFTQKLYEEQNWQESDLKQIQFYVSEDIILQRKYVEGETRIQEGKIRSVNGEKIEELIFPKGTPCIYLFSPKSNRFAISFEQSEPPKFLMFGPNPKFGNRYVLLGKEWDRNMGTISYNESSWYTPSNSAYAGLLVDMKKARSLQKSSRVVKGVRVGE